MSRRSKFPELRAELRKREAHSKTIGKRIRETRGEERMKLWEEKRDYGRATRRCLLLLTLLREKPRVWCEPAWDQNYTPYLAYLVVDEAKRFGQTLDHKVIRAWLEARPSVAVAETACAEALPDHQV